MLGTRPVANITRSVSSIARRCRRALTSAVAGLLDARRCSVAVRILMPRLAHLARAEGADVLVEAAQHGRGRDRPGSRLDAEAVEDAGELHRDVAAADDHDALGQLGQVEGLVRGDGVLDARDRRARSGRPPVAIRILSAVTVLAADLDGVAVDQAAAALDAASTPALRAGGRRSPFRRAISLSVVATASPSRMARRSTRPAVAGRVLELVRELARRRPGASWARSRGSRRCRRRGAPRRSPTRAP